MKIKKANQILSLLFVLSLILFAIRNNSTPIFASPETRAANVAAWQDAFFGQNPPAEYVGGLETWKWR